MKARVSSYEQRDAVCDLTRRCGGAIGHGLRVLVRLWGEVALDAAEGHLRGLDDRTLMDLGFDPRDLPLRDQLARGGGSSSRMSNTRMVMDYWQ